MSQHETQHVPTRGPIREAHTHFDYNAVDGAEIKNATEREFAETMVRFLQWLTPTVNGRIEPNICGKRVIALAHAVSPAIITGSPSIRRLAKLSRISKSELSRQVAAARHEMKKAANKGGQ